MTRIAAIAALTGMLLFPVCQLTAQAVKIPAETIQKTDSTSCGVVDYEGLEYRTVRIGTQCWMRDNLNVGKWTDQGILMKPNDSVIHKYCYGNNFVLCDQWGGLYQWDEMMQYVETSGAQGICPAGWHIPTALELKTLISFLGGDKVAGAAMKTTGSLNWEVPNLGATNSSGFSALPGGYLDYMAQKWYDQYKAGYYWTSEKMSSGTAEAMYLNSRTTEVTRYEEYRPSALSVRCIRNN